MAVLIAALVGLVLGFIGGSVFVLIPWAVVGLVIGWFSRSRKAALLNGAVYGFVMSLVFMLHGYTGTDPIGEKVAGFIFLALFGAVCGLILALVGRLINRQQPKPKAEA